MYYVNTHMFNNVYIIIPSVQPSNSSHLVTCVQSQVSTMDPWIASGTDGSIAGYGSNNERLGKPRIGISIMGYQYSCFDPSL